jgi:hypothetical protein
MSRLPRLALMLLAPALAAIAVYLPTLPGGFLSDDYSELHHFWGADARENLARVAHMFVSGVGPPSNQYRPLTMATFAVNTMVNGADAAAWRAVNILLHAANAALVALLCWQLAGPASRWARAAAAAAGVAFAWFAPSVEAVAWIAARFDGLALLWTLVAACAFMASERWTDRYALASLGATVLAFTSKESAALGPVLIAALAWARRPLDEGLVRSGVRALVDALPWLALAAAYLAFRTWLFGDPMRFYPGTSPGRVLLSGQWLLALRGMGEWLPVVLPEALPRQAYGVAVLLLGVGALTAAYANPRERRMLAAIVLATTVSLALLFSHWQWSARGEGGRVLHPVAAIVTLALALPLRAAASRLRVASWVAAAVLLGSGLLLTRGAVERRVEAGAQVNALVAALRETAEALPAGAYAFVIAPDHIGAIPFARNGQGGLMLPPVQPRSLAPQLVVQLAVELPAWPAQLEANIIGRLKSEPLDSVTAAPGKPGTSLPFALPDRYYCWSPAKRALVPLALTLEPGFRNWDAEWERALDAAACRDD